MAPPLLLVWDFDWSLINENSDTYVLKLDASGALRSAIEQRLDDGAEWTPLMDWLLGELHALGVRPAALTEALGEIPVLAGALDAVECASSLGVEQRILSDANSVYISEILAARGISDYFTAVETNPAWFDGDGRLHVRPHQGDASAHGCPHCPPNLCKGRVLQRWLDGMGDCNVAYVGDGGGDFCPATRLRAGDVLLARRAPHDGLLARVRECADEVAATVVEWDGEDEGAALAAALRDFASSSSSDAAQSVQSL